MSLRVNEIMTIGKYSLIETVREDGEVKCYSVVTHLNNAKAFGNKWDSTICCFETWDNPKEVCKRLALAAFSRIFAEDDVEFYKGICVELLNLIKEDADDEEEFFDKILDNTSIDEDELSDLGFEKPKRYKKVRVTFTRKFYCTKIIVVPEDCDDYEEFVDPDDIHDSDFCDSLETEMDEDYVEEDGLSLSEARECDAYNSDDIE